MTPETAAAKVMELCSELSAPSAMTQHEAVEFYQLVAEQCSDWAETIQSEMDTDTE